MTIKAGDKMPEGTFTRMTGDGPQKMTTDQLFAGKTVVLFSVPGAFTGGVQPLPVGGDGHSHDRSAEQDRPDEVGLVEIVDDRRVEVEHGDLVGVLDTDKRVAAIG